MRTVGRPSPPYPSRVARVTPLCRVRPRDNRGPTGLGPLLTQVPGCLSWNEERRTEAPQGFLYSTTPDEVPREGPVGSLTPRGVWGWRDISVRFPTKVGM